MTQYAQQRELFGERPRDPEERRRIGMELAVSLSDEVHDYLRELGHNRILPPPPDSRYNRLVEIADLLKMTLALAWLDDFTAEELVQAFYDKSVAVQERYRLPFRGKRVAAFDIDGVIADGFTTFANERPMACQPLDSAVQVVRALSSAGWGIIYVTTRKRQRDKSLEADTYRWFSAYDIPCDRILWSYDKSAAILDARLPVRFMVEDSPKHAIDVAEAGIPVYYVGKQEVPEHSNIVGIELRQLHRLLDKELGGVPL